MLIKKRIGAVVLALFTFGVAVMWGAGWQTQAQENAVPIAPLPGSATEYKPPTPSPSASPVLISPTAAPTVSPTASPQASPTGAPTGAPTALPTPNLPLVPIAPPPLPPAAPLPTAGEHQDSRLRVAILKDYKRLKDIGGTVLFESPDGSMAYTAFAQPAPSNYITPETLAEMAKNTFKQGEGFRPGSPQPIPGGIQMDWSGELTIGGQPQPVNGVIVAKPMGAQVLLLLIAATEKAGATVPNAAAALTDSLQAVQ
jgi:hypothetical protein